MSGLQDRFGEETPQNKSVRTDDLIQLCEEIRNQAQLMVAASVEADQARFSKEYDKMLHDKLEGAGFDMQDPGQREKAYRAAFTKFIREEGDIFDGLTARNRLLRRAGELLRQNNDTPEPKG